MQNEKPKKTEKRPREGSDREADRLAPYRFAPGQSGNPRGRPRNRINDAINRILGDARAASLEESLTGEEVNTIERAAMQMNVSDIKAIAGHPDTPAYLKAIAIAIAMEMQEGKVQTLEKLRDRQYGAVKQKMDVKGDITFAEMLMKSSAAESLA